MANHSQDERPRRVRLSQRGELPSTVSVSLILIVFVRFLFAASRRGKQAGRKRCLKV